MTSGERVSVSDFIKQSNNQLIIDVRSPKEFTHAHIPGAVNIPIFDDEERRVIGTLYKQESRQQAIKTGLDFFGPKMRLIVENVERLVRQKQSITTPNEEEHDRTKDNIFIYCWRGGMRSAAIAWLLQLYGFKVSLLAGGYKSYRRWTLQALAFPYQLRVLGGFTGSGKTEVLHQLKAQGEIVIDLEALANHKGSAFGRVGEQPSQEQFENSLALYLYRAYEEAKSAAGTPDYFKDIINKHKHIWVEDESQRIGHLNIPQALWQTMRQSPICFLDIPFEERLQHITEEYAGLNKEYIAGGIQRISKRLGGVATKNALSYLQEGNMIECFRVLLSYYDKTYMKGLHNRNDLSSLLTKVACGKVTACNANHLLSNLTVV